MPSKSINQSKELSLALNIAQTAGEIALQHFAHGVSATMKSDNTPVTVADQECERMIREMLGAEFPHDAILGEEEGESSDAALAKRKWIIDPIDGTYNYARQIPVWSMLIALEDAGEIVLGVVHAPAMEETFWAERSAGAFRNGERTHVSKISQMDQAQFVFGAPSRVAAMGLWDGLKRVVETTYRQRAFGDYLTFAHVFNGKAEAGLEVGVKPWDLAPMKIIVEEAGGRYTDLKGGGSIYDGSCLVSNGLLHDEMLRLLLGD